MTADTDTQGVAQPLSFHLDRLNAWLTDLWAAESLTLHMCDGTVRTGQSGVLRDIRDDVMALRRAYLSAAQEPDYANLLSVITDIRMKSGLGAKPMLSELADAIGDLRANLSTANEHITRQDKGIAELVSDKERLEQENETYRTAFDGIDPAERRLAEQGQAQAVVTEDRAENTTDNPKSWIAWKRRALKAEANLAARGDPLDEIKTKIGELERQAKAGEYVIATLITNLKTGKVTPELAVEWFDKEGRAALTAAKAGGGWSMKRTAKPTVRHRKQGGA
ncbi:MAG TPA: hypothetical protein VFJ18_12120 [Pararhizobium sp.]|nr:hypothetical protein [Pararhizobium sp.]